ncbi:MAG TPA: DUF3501 family protein [Nevskia sp.]|jgi:hypothetical protein|nr:DUF3501 family protein [Nevskia sp.]
MSKLAAADLMKLEEYAERRTAFRARVLQHKKPRKLHLGPHLTLLFEDRLTIQYQVQEMLRIERIFERKAIEEELEAYNPLIPDGSNWKASCLIEYEDPAERARRLVELKGVEHRIWVQVGEGPRITAVADEDLDRENETKTSAVHFLRFELDAASARAAKAGAALSFGVDHPAYREAVQVSEATREALAADLA